MNNDNLNSKNFFPRLAVMKLLLAISFVSILSGCAGNQTSEDKSADRVVQRAEARWEAVLSDDLETAYTFYTPGYRSTVSVVDFGVSMKLRRVRYISAEFLDKTCENQRCVLRFKVGFAVERPAPGVETFESKSVLEEVWLNTDGEWWFLPKK